MKLGLILEGGASRAYYTSGILDALLEEEIIADYVIGTSAGIANGVSYVSRQVGRNLCIAKDYLHDKRYMGFKHMLNPFNRSFYNLKFAFDDVPNRHLPFDYEAFKSFTGNVVAAVTNLDTGKAEYLEMPRDDKKFQLLRATCALPLLFPVIKIDGKPYMDGGICAPIPASAAINAGCDKNIVILTRERGYQKQPEKALQMSARKYKKYPNFADALLKRTETYNENLAQISNLEKEGKVFVIAPESMNMKRLETDPEKLEQLHIQGYNQFKNTLPALLSYLND